MDGNNDFFENFERNKYLKKLPSMQRVMISSSATAFICQMMIVKIVYFSFANNMVCIPPASI